MNIELTKEQSQKGDNLLKKLLSEGALQRQSVYDFFNDRDEAIVVCKTLEQKGIIVLNAPTYNEPFMMVIPEDGIFTFLKNGGLLKEYKNSKKHFTKYQMVYLIGFFIFGLLGTYKILFPTVSESDFQNVKTDLDSLNSRLDSIVKSTSKPTFEKLNDTLQTKSLTNLKID